MKFVIETTDSLQSKTQYKQPDSFDSKMDVNIRS